MVGTVPRRVLVAYSKAESYTTALQEYLVALKRFTPFEVHYLHVTHDAQIDVDLNDYDVLFNNFCARFCFEGLVSADYERAVQAFRGLKIMSVQDDYNRTSVLHRAIRRLGFHVLLTCIQPEFIRFAYPPAEIPGVSIIHGLTGYVPEQLSDKARMSRPLEDRDTWVAYRGRTLGAQYGRLGYEKYLIGERMITFCAARGIPYDIAMDEQSRIYGEAWYDFLASSRTMLGSESASNAFDFDGLLERAVSDFTAREGRPPTYAEFKSRLDPIEAPFDVGQISPRVFECAAMRTPMILFRGGYSGAVKPDEHYIALEKDFSNADAVLDLLTNLDGLRAMADRAHAHLVASGDYGYRSLGRLVTNAIEEFFPRRVDQAFVEYRARTGEAYASRRLPVPPSSEADARRIAFSECPTEMPAGPEDLAERYETYARLSEDASLRAALGRLQDDDVRAMYRDALGENERVLATALAAQPTFGQSPEHQAWRKEADALRAEIAPALPADKGNALRFLRQAPPLLLRANAAFAAAASRGEAERVGAYYAALIDQFDQGSVAAVARIFAAEREAWATGGARTADDVVPNAQDLAARHADWIARAGVLFSRAQAEQNTEIYVTAMADLESKAGIALRDSGAPADAAIAETAFRNALAAFRTAESEWRASLPAMQDASPIDAGPISRDDQAARVRAWIETGAALYANVTRIGGELLVRCEALRVGKVYADDLAKMKGYAKDTYSDAWNEYRRNRVFIDNTFGGHDGFSAEFGARAAEIDREWILRAAELHRAARR